MDNKEKLPDFLIEGFLMGDLTNEEEKKLLNWIHQSSENINHLKEKQDSLRQNVVTRGQSETNEPWHNLLGKIQPLPVDKQKKKSKILIWTRISAAAVVISFVCYLVFSDQLFQKEVKQIAMKEVVTPFGEKSNVTLPDGTKVNLNSGSSLKYPAVFTGQNRNVELSGEAFFEVTPNPEKPFIVSTNSLQVKVLGTSFNLEAYPDSREINTTLINGKVMLEKAEGGKYIQLAELKPNERAVYSLDNKQMTVSTESNMDQYVSWKDGKLVFFKAPIEEVVHKLGLWYNVSVSIRSEELKTAHFTCTFTDESLEQVLNLLSVSYPINYKIIKSNNPSVKSQNNGTVILSIRN